MPVDAKIGYIPKQSEKTIKNGFFGWDWPNFKLNSLATHYSIAKFFGWFFEATYHDATKYIDKIVFKNEKLIRVLDSSNLANTTEVNLSINPKAKKIFNIVEGIVFAGISLFSFYLERTQYQLTIYDAMAAERGVPHEKIGLFSMMKSKNPFVRSLRDRFVLQQATRIPSAILFGLNKLTFGIIALITNFTLERSIFVENNAFDLLNSMLHQVQNTPVSENRDREHVFTELERSVQRVLADNHRPPLTEAQLVANKEAFEQMTTQVLAGKFRINETVYLLGGIANHPDFPQTTLFDIEKITALGIRNFARQKGAFNRTEIPAKPAAQTASLTPEPAATPVLGKATQAQLDRRAGATIPVQRDLPSEDVMGAASRAIAQRREMEHTLASSPALGAA